MPFEIHARLLSVADPFLAGRLFAMGITPGKRIRICRRAMLGGAYYLVSGNFCFILRAEEFRSLNLEILESAS